jgi:hypothetical protein
MKDYIIFALMWVGFMALIAAVTVSLPKIAGAVDKWLKGRKLSVKLKKGRKSVYSPITEEELEETKATSDTNEMNGD